MIKHSSDDASFFVVFSRSFFVLIVPGHDWQLSRWQQSTQLQTPTVQPVTEDLLVLNVSSRAPFPAHHAAGTNAEDKYHTEF